MNHLFPHVFVWVFFYSKDSFCLEHLDPFFSVLFYTFFCLAPFSVFIFCTLIHLLLFAAATAKKEVVFWSWFLLDDDCLFLLRQLFMPIHDHDDLPSCFHKRTTFSFFPFFMLHLGWLAGWLVDRRREMYLAIPTPTLTLASLTPTLETSLLSQPGWLGRPPFCGPGQVMKYTDRQCLDFGTCHIYPLRLVTRCRGVLHVRGLTMMPWSYRSSLLEKRGAL
jgi:hypothetical protein